MADAEAAPPRLKERGSRTVRTRKKPATDTPLVWSSHDDEEIFWDTFVRIEQGKDFSFQPTMSRDPSRLSVEFGILVVNLRYWLANLTNYRMKKFLSKFATSLTPKDRTADPKEEETLFPHYFIDQTKFITFSVFFMNLVFLLAFLAVVPSRASDLEESRFDSMWPVALHVAIWTIFSTITVAFYVALIGGYLPPNPDNLRFVEFIGYGILCFRALVLATSITIGVTHAECYFTNILSPHDNSFRLGLFLMVVEAYQIFAVSMLPLRYPWIQMMCAVELVVQMTRLTTCTARIDVDLSQNFLICTGVLLGLYYLFVGVLPAGKLEHSAFSTFRVLLKLKSAAREKTGLVNVLCSDLKVPLQHMRQQMETYCFLVRDPNSQCLLRDVEDNMASVTLTIDHMLTLLRIEEHRFTFALQDKTDIRLTVMSAFKSIQCSHGWETTQDVSSQLLDLSVNPPNCVTNQCCLSILVYFSIAALIAQSNAGVNLSAATGVPNFPESQRRSLFSIIVEPVSRVTGNRSLVVEVRTSSRVGKVTTADLHHYQSCLMICKHVVNSYGGAFDCHQAGVIRFDIPYTLDTVQLSPSEAPRKFWPGKTSPVYTPSAVPSAEIDAVESTRNSRPSTANQSDTSRLHELMLKQTCVYSADAHMRRFVLDIIEKIRDGRDDLPLFTTLNMADLQIRSVVIVTSLGACKELRAREFEGLIILLSDRLAYLDDEERAMFDFALPLPCSAKELAEMIAWLNQHYADFFSGVNQNGFFHPRSYYESFKSLLVSGSKHEDEENPTSYERLQLGDDFSEHNKRRIGEWAAVVSDHWKYAVDKMHQLLARFPSIPAEQELNYVRWLRLNTSPSVYHRTVYLDLAWMSVASYTMLLWFTSPRSVGAFAIALPVLFTACIRRIRTKTITWMGRHFLTVYRIFDLVFVLMLVIGMTISLFSPQDGRFGLPKPTHPPTTFGEFLLTQYGNLNGRAFFMFVLIYPLRARSMLELLSWPYCLIPVVYMGLLVMAVFNAIIGPMMLERPKRLYLFLLFIVNFTLCVVICLTEVIQRSEFKRVRNYIITRDFLDRCMGLCWKLNLRPLETLSAHKQHILLRLRDGAEDFSVPMTPHLVESLERSCLQLALMGSLLQDLQMSGEASVNKNDVSKKNSLLSRMEVELVQPLARRVCSLYAKNTESMQINVFLKVHPGVQLVKCDGAMLAAVLSRACRFSTMRITSAVQEAQQSVHAVSHDIVVCLSPHAGQERLKFTDIRMMDVTVLDTVASDLDAPQSVWGPTAPDPRAVGHDDHHPNLYMRYMKQHHLPGLYEQRAIDSLDGRYKHVQLIGVPYKLSTLTHKIAAHFGGIKLSAVRLHGLHTTSMAAYENMYGDLLGRPAGSARTSGNRVSIEAVQGFLKMTVLTCRYQERSEAVRCGSYYRSGWERRVERVEATMPASALFLNAHCVLIDANLYSYTADEDKDHEAEHGVDVEAVRTHAFLHELLLYLRCHDYQGLVAVAFQRGTVVLDEVRTSTRISSSTARGSTTADAFLKLPLTEADLEALRLACMRRMMRNCVPEL